MKAWSENRSRLCLQADDYSKLKRPETLIFSSFSFQKSCGRENLLNSYRGKVSVLMWLMMIQALSIRWTHQASKASVVSAKIPRRSLQTLLCRAAHAMGSIIQHATNLLLILCTLVALSSGFTYLFRQAHLTSPQSTSLPRVI